MGAAKAAPGADAPSNSSVRECVYLVAERRACRRREPAVR
jgi:hypothetical protein